MPKKKIFPSPFTKKQESINTAMLSLHTQRDTKSSEWYQSISKLPLNKFIEVLVEGNFSALIISGNPDSEQLHQSWSDIYSDYIDAIADAKFNHRHNLLKKIGVLTLTLSQIEMLVEICTALIDHSIHYPPFTKKLNDLLKTSFDFDPNKPEEYKKLLKRCWNRRSGFKIELGLKEAELAAIDEKESGTGEKYSYQYFQGFLIALSDHAKYSIQDNISVYEYCQRVKRVIAHNELITKSIRK